MARIFVKAKPNAKADRVIAPQPRLMSEADDLYIVETREKPVDGRANEAIARLLAEHFGVARSQIELISGATSRRKVFEIK